MTCQSTISIPDPYEGEEFFPGDTITVYVTVENTGTETCEAYPNETCGVPELNWVEVHLEDPNGNRRDTCEEYYGSLAPGDRITLTCQVTIPSDATPGVWTLYTWTMCCCNGTLTSSDFTRRILVVEPVCDISASITSPGAGAVFNPGDTINGEITVSNIGNQTCLAGTGLSNYYVYLVDPNGATRDTYSANFPNDLPPDSSMTLPFTLTIPSDAPPGTWTIKTLRVQCCCDVDCGVSDTELPEISITVQEATVDVRYRVIDSETGDPVQGVLVEVYPGQTTCTGTPADSDVTDAQGYTKYFTFTEGETVAHRLTATGYNETCGSATYTTSGTSIVYITPTAVCDISASITSPGAGAVFNPGDTINGEITVSNIGNQTCLVDATPSSYQATLVMPDGTTVVDIYSDAFPGELPPGSNMTLPFTLTIPSDAPPGTWTIRAVVGCCCDASCNTVDEELPEISITVQEAPPCHATNRITSPSEGDVFHPGDKITGEVVINNLGEQTCRVDYGSWCDVNLWDPQSYIVDTYQIPLEDIQPGETKTYQFTLTVPSDAELGGWKINTILNCCCNPDCLYPGGEDTFINISVEQKPSRTYLLLTLPALAGIIYLMMKSKVTD